VSATALYHSFTLPWTIIREELERLKRILIVVMVITLVLGFIVPLVPVKKVDRSKVEELPPRFAQLVMERQKPPPPPPPKVEKKPEKKPEKKKPEKKPEKKKPEPKPKPKPKPEKTAEQKRADARKKASSVGLMAFADELSDIRDKPLTTALKKNTKLSNKGASAKKVTRNVITSDEIVTSGGIDTSKISSGLGGSTDLEDRETTKVESGIEKLAARGGESSTSDSGKPRRTFEEVSMVFDRNKGQIYNLYNRELRKDPGIAGKIVFKLVIASDGSVVSVEIVSSELNSPRLEKKLKIRIRGFNFGSKPGAENLTVTFPLDFLPS